jgi:hypothetical protein
MPFGVSVVPMAMRRWIWLGQRRPTWQIAVEHEDMRNRLSHQTSTSLQELTGTRSQSHEPVPMEYAVRPLP